MVLGTIRKPQKANYGLRSPKCTSKNQLVSSSSIHLRSYQKGGRTKGAFSLSVPDPRIGARNRFSVSVGGWKDGDTYCEGDFSALALDLGRIHNVKILCYALLNLSSVLEPRLLVLLLGKINRAEKIFGSKAITHLTQI